MLTIKCAECKKKIFKYKKIGKGRVLRCYTGRILKDYSARDGENVLCECGNLIGIDRGVFIEMKQSSFTRSGTVSKK